MSPIWSTEEMTVMVKSLLPDYKDSFLDLSTITAKESVKNKEIVLEFRYEVLK